ncbi:MAG: hypothetical protein ACOC93_05810, partial [Planctomycetota bacterium]
MLGYPTELAITVAAPGEHLTAAPFVSRFGLPHGLAVSFCHPVVDRRGRVLVPVQAKSIDSDGELRRLGIQIDEAAGVAKDHRRVALLIGEFADADTVDWKLGGFVPMQAGLSSRGLCEGTVAEIEEGRLAMIMRGSNHLWPDKPAYKWLSFSTDGGLSWSDAEPLPCDE